MLLFISNGIGEDIIARRIIERILKFKDIKIFVYPLVGVGKAFIDLPVELLDPRKEFPSGGFSIRALGRGLFSDLKSGFIPFFKEQLKTLRKMQDLKMELICVGDTYNLIMGSLTKKKAFFLPTAKSVLNSSFYYPEIYLMKKLTKFIFTRDNPTSEYLRKYIPWTYYLGNPMFDGLDDEFYSDGQKVIVLLPGSRTEAIENLKLMLKTCEIVYRSYPDFSFEIVLSPYLPIERKDIIEKLVKSYNFPVNITCGEFNNVVKRAYLVLGLAGTANEQAVYMGKLVVSFPGKGPQITQRFLKMQKALLGEGLELAKDFKEAGEKIIYFIEHPEEKKSRAFSGKERLGRKGADNIAKFILQNINL